MFRGILEILSCQGGGLLEPKKAAHVGLSSHNIIIHTPDCFIFKDKTLKVFFSCIKIEFVFSHIIASPIGLNLKGKIDFYFVTYLFLGDYKR